MKFSKRRVDRTRSLEFACRKVGLLEQLRDQSDGSVITYIGFNKREMKRRDVAKFVGGEPTVKTCTLGLPFRFEARIWFYIGGELTRAEWKRYQKGRYAPPSRRL
jgi:hypothetical protein